MFNPIKFLNILKSISGPNLFNPYIDICELHDKPNANKIRESNLLNYLGIMDQCEILMVGEGPGFLGCRRTGLAFTDNRHLPIVEEIYSLNKFQIATKSGKDKENSALYMWRVVKQITNKVFIWNLIPLHPHKKDNPLTNRTPIND